MTRYYGDRNLGTTVRIQFNTNGSAGAAIAGSSLGLTSYQDGSTVQNTTGIVFVTTHDTLVGYNDVAVSMEATSTHFQTGSVYHCVVSSGTVDGQNVIGQVVGSWRCTPEISEVVGLPDSTARADQILGHLYSALIHQLKISASGKTFHDSSGNVKWVKGLLDDGTTYVELIGATST